MDYGWEHRRGWVPRLFFVKTFADSCQGLLDTPVAAPYRGRTWGVFYLGAMVIFRINC